MQRTQSQQYVVQRRHALLHNTFDTQTVRGMERPLLDQGVELMNQAAAATARVVYQLLEDSGVEPEQSHVVLLAGAGDNGGDGLFAAAELAGEGVSVTAIAVGGSLHDEALASFMQSGGRILVLDPESEIPGCAAGFDGDEANERFQTAVDLAHDSTLILDAMTGIGLHGSLHGIAGRLAAGLGLDADSPDRAAIGDDGRPTTPIVVAVDVPSGIGVDDGTLPGPYIAADVTVMFGAMKPCAMLPPAAYACGAVTLVDFDFDIDDEVAQVEAVDIDMARDAIRLPRLDDSKYSRGVVGLITGSERYPGAARLSTASAARTNTGMVRYIGPAQASRMVLDTVPETVLGKGHVQSWVVGSGVPARTTRDSDPEDNPEAAQSTAIASLLAHYALVVNTVNIGQPDMLGDPEASFPDTDSPGTPAIGSGAEDSDVEEAYLMPPVCVDAGALDLLPERVPPHVVITPHAGELARLLRSRGEDIDAAEVRREPWRSARLAHELTGATVLLKGAITIVVGDDGTGGTRTIITGSAPAWLATAGAGDVLAGMLGGLLAQQDDLLEQDPSLSIEIAAVAAYLHGLAAGLACESDQRGWNLPVLYGTAEPAIDTEAGHPITASDVIDAIAPAVGDILA